MPCECGSTKIYTDPDSGEQTCMKCGLVLVEHSVNYGVDKWDYPEKPDRRRFGEFITPDKTDHVKGSIIHRMDIGIGTEDAATFYRMRREQIKSGNATSSRNLAHAMRTLDMICSQLNAPQHIRHEGAKLYRKALDADLIKGRTIDHVVTACVYAGYRIHGEVMMLKDIAKTTDMKHTEVASTYRLLYDEGLVKPKLDKVKPHIKKIVGKLKLPSSVELRGMEILEEAVEKRLTHGKSPAGIAAAIVYIAAKIDLGLDNVTQANISRASGVTEVTIRNRYTKLLEDLDRVNDSAPDPKQTEQVRKFGRETKTTEPSNLYHRVASTRDAERDR